MNKYVVFASSLVDEGYISWNIEAENEDEAYNVGMGIALKSSLADSGTVSVLEENTYRLAKQFNIIHRISTFKDYLDSIEGISEVSFDLSGLLVNIKEVIVTCRWAVPSDVSYYTARSALKTDVIEAAKENHLVQTQDRFEDQGYHFFVVFDLSEWMKENEKNVKYNSNTTIFNSVIEQIRENGDFPENIDFVMAAGGDTEIQTTEFEIRSNLDYGASEGIYLDFAAEMFEDGRMTRIPLGTIKTLDVSKESFERMGTLLGDFMYFEHKYVSKHYDDFDRTGYAVKGILADGTEGTYSLLSDTYERAVARVDEIFASNKTRDPDKQFVKVQILNKRSREKVIIAHEDTFSDFVRHRSR